MTYNIALLAGDGIGPEILASTQCVLDQACADQGIRLTYNNVTIGFNALAATGSTFPERCPKGARGLPRYYFGAGISQRLSATDPRGT